MYPLQHPDEPLVRSLLAALDENAALRSMVLDMAAGLPLDAEQRRLLSRISDGEFR